MWLMQDKERTTATEEAGKVNTEPQKVPKITQQEAAASLKATGRY